MMYEVTIMTPRGEESHEFDTLAEVNAFLGKVEVQVNDLDQGITLSNHILQES